MKAIIISYGLTFFDNVPRRMDLTVLLLKCHVTLSYFLLNVFLLIPNPLGWKFQISPFLFGHLQICVWYSLPQTHVCINMKILKLSLNIPLLISKLKVLDKDILFFSGLNKCFSSILFCLQRRAKEDDLYLVFSLSQTELCSGEFELYLLLLSISVTWKHSRHLKAFKVFIWWKISLCFRLLFNKPKPFVHNFRQNFPNPYYTWVESCQKETSKKCFPSPFPQIYSISSKCFSHLSIFFGIFLSDPNPIIALVTLVSNWLDRGSPSDLESKWVEEPD